MKIILDAMGGDNAPEEIVKGAVLAADTLGVSILLVGDEARIRPLLMQNPPRDPSAIEIQHAGEVITMEDNPVSAVRQKKDSSLVVSLRLLGEGKGDAFVCAGSTGAVLTGATLFVKRIKGVRRAALAPVLPTARGGSLLVDCGANVECTAEYLTQFAFMGYYYAKKQLGIENPTVGLINNGAEETKGTDALRETYQILKKAAEEGKINFIGNVEGRDIPSGAADVLVCDGFTGNIVLKTIEGVGLFFVGKVKEIFKKNALTKLSALAVKPGLQEFKKLLDYNEVGGAPLLGISKPIIKAHGSSGAVAIMNAVRQAVVYTEGGVIADIAKSVGQLPGEAGEQAPDKKQ